MNYQPGGAGPGLGPSPGWGPVRVGAHLGPWGPYGPIEPLWAHGALMGPYGPDFVLRIINFDEKDKIVNKNIKIVNLEILKVKSWFWNKDSSSLDSID